LPLSRIGSLFWEIQTMKFLHTLTRGAAALALFTGALAAQAATFNFSGTVNFGPQLGQQLSGQFSFDDAAAALAGPDGTVALSSLSLSFLGQTFQLAQAIDPYAQFEGGQLLGPNAGFSGFATPAATLQLQSFFGSSGFTFSANGQDSLGDLTISAVPEPASWALGLAGLAVLAGLSRRRRVGFSG
jgi:MYXO-CTERM domain-containing protein